MEYPVIDPQAVPVTGPVKRHRWRKIAYLLLLIIIIAGAGYGIYYWQHKDLTAAQQQAIALRDENAKLNRQIAQLKSANSNKRSGAADTLQLPDATQLVKTFYTQYMSNVGKDASVNKALVKQYGTANLAFYAEYYQHGFDNIICAQMKPNTFEVSGDKVAGNVASVTVNSTYNTEKVTITARVVDQGGLKIDAVTCPGSKADLPPVKTP